MQAIALYYALRLLQVEAYAGTQRSREAIEFMLQLPRQAPHPSLQVRPEVFYVQGKHHTLLHDQTTGAQPSDVLTAHFSTQLLMSPSLNLQQAASASHLTKVPRTIFTQVLLATARVFVEAPNGFRVLVRALIDQCSQVSIASQSLCQRLKLKQTHSRAYPRSRQ